MVAGINLLVKHINSEMKMDDEWIKFKNTVSKQKEIKKSIIRKNEQTIEDATEMCQIILNYLKLNNPTKNNNNNKNDNENNDKNEIGTKEWLERMFDKHIYTKELLKILLEIETILETKAGKVFEFQGIVSEFAFVFVFFYFIFF